MESSKVYIIQANSENPQLFTFDSLEITFGRNPCNSIDIPDRLVSRHQCILKQVNRDQWLLEDTSSQKTTVLNGNPLKGSSAYIKSSDVITFCHSSVKFIFYQNYELLPSTYKKRKRDESDLDSTLNKDTLLNELEKYKVLYEKAVNDMETFKAANSAVTEELTKELQNKIKSEQDLKSQLQLKDRVADILRQQVSETQAKLKVEEAANDQMIIRIQNLTESLKDCEEENERLMQEAKLGEHRHIKAEIKDEELTKGIIEDSPIENSQEAVKSTCKETSDLFSVDAFDTIMGMVEVKWQEKEIENLKEELKQKVDQITDLTFESTRHRQDLLDLIDRELLCSICSEIMCNVITLSCMHSFCKTCLTEWKEKKRECPVCRTKIKTEVHPLVLDSFIDRLCDLVGGDVNSRRNEVKAERSKLPASTCSDEGGNKWRNRRRSNNTPRRRRAPFQHPFHINPVPMYQDNGEVVIDVGEAFFPINVIDLTLDSPLRGPTRRSHRIQHNNNNNAL